MIARISLISWLVGLRQARLKKRATARSERAVAKI